MKVRSAIIRDLSEIVSLWWEMQSSHFEYDLDFYGTKEERIAKEISTDYFKFYLNKKNHIIIVMEEEQKLIGMLHCELSIRPPIFKEEKTAKIMETVVSEDFRGRGIFQIMFEYLKKELKSRNIRMCALSVDIENKRGIHAYLRSGFKERQKFMICKL